MEKKDRKTSVEKALDLIETLKEKDDLGVTELSQILGLNKNYVFRLLATLEVIGLIEQDEETGHYKLGIKTLQLEYAFIKNLEFLKKAKPFIKRLRNETNETVYISLLHNNDIVYIYSEESRSSVLVHSRIAKRFPAEKTAPGRAILKSKKEKRKDFIFEYDIEKTEPEVSEIATIIKGDSKNIIAALSIVAPISRLNEGNIHSEIKELLLSTAMDISESLSPNPNLV